MKLNELIVELMRLDDYTCPCEVGIPCPFFNPDNKSNYCDPWCRCEVGVELCIREIVKNEEEKEK